MQNLAKHKKKKDTICEHTCANCSCQNVSFFQHFSFSLIFEFPFFRDVFWEVAKNQKKQKIWKQQKQKTTTTTTNRMQSKNKSKIAIQNKTRQQAEKKQKHKNILEPKANKPITKSKNQKLTWETEARKKGKNNRERQKQEKVKKGEAKKRLKRNKGKHWKMNNKNGLF